MECVRHGLNHQELQDALDDLKLDTQLKSVITEFYEEHKLVLSQKLVKIGTFLPQVVDARWKLECVTQVNNLFCLLPSSAQAQAQLCSAELVLILLYPASARLPGHPE